MKNFIWITTQFEGFHTYKDAPDEVALLRNEHRHMFHVKVWIEVYHNDRDIEFILFKNSINDFLQTDGRLNNMSCEMISDELYTHIHTFYDKRDVKIEISEDGENGSYKEYEKVK